MQLVERLGVQCGGDRHGDREAQRLLNAPLRKLSLNRFRAELTLIVLTYPHEAVWGRCRD
jgi:hypothetical protein